MVTLASGLGCWLSHPASTPFPVDLIVVLGGGSTDRAGRGAQLFAAGLASSVLLTGAGNIIRSNNLSQDRRSAILHAAGVPPRRLFLNGMARSSWEEALAVRDLLSREGWSKALIVSDPPHLRRLDWVFKRIFLGTPYEYRLISSQVDWWHCSIWWTNWKATKFVVNEVGKLIFYWSKYRHESKQSDCVRCTSHVLEAVD